ncbi:MAG TPA: rhodanese-like domain-containing protein [Candidatus Baltobacteraceae bacterium]|jgi:rhodanese-related sulfurtransferase
MQEISVDELARWRSEQKAFVLLDVREPHELTLASLDGATHVPMRDLPARLNELDKDAEIAVLCHHGGRSAQVARFLTQHGFANVYNVDGGINEYATRIDPSIPTYR